jgi:hypothetical protein
MTPVLVSRVLIGPATPFAGWYYSDGSRLQLQTFAAFLL